MACTGLGTTATFGTSSFSANIKSISFSWERASIETSHMATTTTKTFCPDDLQDAGTIDMTLEYDGTQLPPLAGSAETLVIDVAGAGVNNKVNFAGVFLINWSAEIPFDGQMTSTVTFKATGAVTIT